MAPHELQLQLELQRMQLASASSSASVSVCQLKQIKSNYCSAKQQRVEEAEVEYVAQTGNETKCNEAKQSETGVPAARFRIRKLDFAIADATAATTATAAATPIAWPSCITPAGLSLVWGSLVCNRPWYLVRPNLSGFRPTCGPLQ